MEQGLRSTKRRLRGTLVVLILVGSTLALGGARNAWIRDEADVLRNRERVTRRTLEALHEATGIQGVLVTLGRSGDVETIVERTRDELGMEAGVILVLDPKRGRLGVHPLANELTEQQLAEIFQAADPALRAKDWKAAAIRAVGELSSTLSRASNPSNRGRGVPRKTYFTPPLATQAPAERPWVWLVSLAVVLVLVVLFVLRRRLRRSAGAA